jgi:hypothetical protein
MMKTTALLWAVFLLPNLAYAFGSSMSFISNVTSSSPRGSSSAPVSTPTPIPTLTPTPTLTNPVPGVGSNAGIMWGMNGHPYGGMLSGGPYANINQQMQLLASLGVKHYRVDFYGTDQAELTLVAQLLAAAKPYGIIVTPVLIVDWGYFTTETASYNASYAFTNAWAAYFKGQIPVYELGNEENASLLPPRNDNSNIAVWEAAPNYPLLRGMFRGMIDGIHAGDPAAKAAVGDAGGCNYGMEEALWQDGLRWDITVLHPYDFWGYPTNLTIAWWNGASEGGCAAGSNMLQMYAQFGKPLWLTEYSWTPGVSANNKTMVGQGLTQPIGDGYNGMMPTFQSLAKLYDIEAADIYELFDEPSIAGGEGQFGIFTSTGATTAASTMVQSYITQNPGVVYTH